MEDAAASELFSDVSEASFGLWVLYQEFVDAETAEAKFARAIDVFLPLFMNKVYKGMAWGNFKVSKQEYMDKKSIIADGSVMLWEEAKILIELFEEQGAFDN